MNKIFSYLCIGQSTGLDMSYEYIVTIPSTIPARKRSKFRAMVKELGGDISKGKKVRDNSSYECAMADVANGRVSKTYDNLEDLFSSLNS